MPTVPFAYLEDIVESSQTQAQTEGEDDESEDDEEEGKEKKKETLGYLSGQARTWLAVLFNVFASVERGERAQIGELIGVWAGVPGENELAGAPSDCARPPQRLPRRAQHPRGPATPEGKRGNTQRWHCRCCPPAQKAEVIAVVVRAGILDASEGAMHKVGTRLVERLVGLDRENVFTAVGGVSALLERPAGAGGAAAAGGKVRYHAPLSTRLSVYRVCRTY
jgi:ribosomal RNA-processing protein 12